MAATTGTAHICAGSLLYIADHEKITVKLFVPDLVPAVEVQPAPHYLALFVFLFLSLARFCLLYGDDLLLYLGILFTNFTYVPALGLERLMLFLFWYPYTRVRSVYPLSVGAECVLQRGG